eukprot:10690029-Karenia_brevis.AAC.1
MVKPLRHSLLCTIEVRRCPLQRPRPTNFQISRHQCQVMEPFGGCEQRSAGSPPQQCTSSTKD